MSGDIETKPSILFWIIAGLFILWGLMGCAIYLMEVMPTDEQYAELFGEELASVRHLVPTWGMAGFAIAVWSGLLAAILFIFRKRISVPVFIVSLVAAVIGFIPSFTISAIRDAGGSFFWLMPLIVVSLGIFEIIFSRKQQAKGILR